MVILSIVENLSREPSRKGTKIFVFSSLRMENKNKISKQKNTTNLSEPDANQENDIAQEKSDRRLDGANRRGDAIHLFFR